MILPKYGLSGHPVNRHLPVGVADVRMMWKMRFPQWGELEGDNKVTNTPIMELIRSQFVSLEEAAMQMQAFASDSRGP